MKSVETKAAATLERCRAGAGLDELPLPIPIEEWIEGQLGIELGFSDLTRFGENVLGAAYTNPRSIQISETLVDQEARLRFTCGHELGHLVLHAGQADSFTDDTVETWDTTQRLERQADRFAAAVLMPVSLLYRELYAVLDQHGFDPPKAVTELMLDSPEAAWLWKKLVLPGLTERFCVSLTALLFRFDDFTLPDGKPFLLPEHRPRLARSLAALYANDPIHEVIKEPGRLQRLRRSLPVPGTPTQHQQHLFA